MVLSRDCWIAILDLMRQYSGGGYLKVGRTSQKGRGIRVATETNQEI